MSEDMDFLFKGSSAAAKRLDKLARKLKRAHEREVFWQGRKQMKKPPEGGSDSRAS